MARVEVVPDMPDIDAEYDDSRRAIVFEQEAGPLIAVHEFCHALDHEEQVEGRWASEDGTDLLLPHTDNFDSDLYPTDVERVHEAFARFCALGPEVPAILDQLARTCGVEDDSYPALRFVRDIAFPDYVASSGWAEMEDTFTLEAGSVTVQDSSRDALSLSAAAVLGQAGVFVLAHAVVEGESPDEPQIESSILLVDPDTLQVTDSLALPAHGAYTIDGQMVLTGHTLIGSSTNPILYAFAGDDAGSAWRVEVEPLTLAPLYWPETAEVSLPHGFENDGKALLQLGYGQQIQLVDLEDASVTPVLEGESLFDGTSPMAFFADDEGAVGVFSGDAGLVAAAVDWSGDVTWSAPLPIPSSRVRSLLRLGDGTVIATPVVQGTEGVDGGASYAVAVRYDPAQGAWSPAGDCDAFAGEGWIARGTTAAKPETVETEAGEYTIQFAIVSL